MQPEVNEAKKNRNFHARMRKEALQTIRYLNAASKRTFEDVLIVFRRKYPKHKSKASDKHKLHNLTQRQNHSSVIL